MNPNPRILVIRGGAIGDFILTLPAIQMLREGIPGAEIEILGYPAIASLAKEAGIADNVRSIEYAGMANYFNPSGVLDPDLVHYFSGFNLVVSYLYDPDGFFKANLERSGVESLVTCSHRIDEQGAPAAAQLARPLEQLALFLENPAPDLPFSPETRARAAELLGPDAGEENEKPLAIHPGSGSPRKNWQVSGWKELTLHLARRYPRRSLVLLSGEADRGIADDLIGFWKAKGIRYCHFHQRDLCEVGAVIAECALYVGHDSGISHLAAATGTPCLLLFGATNADVWAPRNERVHILRAPESDLANITAARLGEEVARFLE